MNRICKCLYVFGIDENVTLDWLPESVTVEIDSYDGFDKCPEIWEA